MLILRSHSHRIQRALVLVILAAILCWLWPGADSLGLADAASRAEGARADVRAYPEYSDRWRIGFGNAREHGLVSDYDIAQLCAGWYHDWGVLYNPPRPHGIEYVQLIRVSENHFDLSNPDSYDWNELNRDINNNPGSIWQIGNEPDGRAPGACDQRLPSEYAQIYKLFYDHIKSVDPTAQIANGAIIQGTPVRMQWLSRVWDEYQTRYGEPWPVDVWNMHNQIVKEVPDEGADIPPGCDPELGMIYGVQDNDNMDLFIDHVVRMRQWMKDRGQQDKPLIISEYGVLQPEYEGFTEDRISEYLERSFTWMMHAKDAGLGMAADDYRLVQRWAWFALNVPLGRLGQQGAWNGSLFDVDTGEITEVGRTFANWACRDTHPTPTPTTTPPSHLTLREAEEGTTHGYMARATDQDVSACRYVHVPVGTQGLLTDTDVTFNVYVPNTGYYYVWGRGYGLDYESNSFSLKVGAYDWQPWRFDVGNWSWKRADGSFYLQGRRWHTIKVGPRVAGHAKLDMLAVTSSSSYQPTDALLEVCNPEPTATPTASSTPTRTLTPTATRTAMPIGAGRLVGQVAYQGRGTAPSSQWQAPLKVSAHLPGDPVPAYLFDVNSSNDGSFEVSSGVLPGTYDVGVRNDHSLRNMRQNVEVNTTTGALDMGTLIEGDGNQDNIINSLDFSRLAAYYSTTQGDPNYDPHSDYNGDGTINALDFSLLANNYGAQGDNILSAQARRSEPQSARLGADPITVRIQPATTTVAPGQTFSVDVYAVAGSQLFHSIDCQVWWNTSYIEFVSASPGSTLTVLANTPYADHYVYGGGSLEAKSGTIRLFTLQLRAKQPVASTTLDLSNVVIGYGEESVPPVPQDGTVVIPAATPTPTRTNTPVWTAVPQPTATSPAGGDVTELVLRQGIGGYSGFEDTFLSEWEQTTNYGTDQTLRLRSNNVKRILWRADLGAVPAGAAIEEAVLTLYETTGSENALNAQVYGMLRPWTGTEADWLQAADGAPWGQAGADEIGVDRSGILVDEQEIFATWGSYSAYPFDLDITELVQAWVDDPLSNYGLIILVGEGASSEMVFGSSDNGSPEHRPQLMVRYRTGAGPTPTETGTASTPTPTPTVTQTPDGETGRIEGYVYVDANGNHAPDAGEGVRDAIVELRDRGGSAWTDTRASDENGHYAFAQVPPGIYLVDLVERPAGYCWPDNITAPPIQLAISAGQIWDIIHFEVEHGDYLPLILTID